MHETKSKGKLTRVEYLVLHTSNGHALPVAYVTLDIMLGEQHPQEFLERVFELTNTFDTVQGPWWWNNGVTKLVDGPQRSTSVGDYISLNMPEYNLFHLWCVESIGFKEITIPVVVEQEQEEQAQTQESEADS